MCRVICHLTVPILTNINKTRVVQCLFTVFCSVAVHQCGMEKQPLFSSTLLVIRKGRRNHHSLTIRGLRLRNTCIRGKIVGSMLPLELPDCGRCQHMKAGDDPKRASIREEGKVGKANG
uniref:Uncharacterized protein n=1 Tax=Anopheles atroparvus TaxID=41427 RepID=A0AAG5D1W9_ANOAO